MDYNSIKAHFKIKQDSGDTCKAVCPSHPDKEASLSIKYDKTNGKTMLKCFAGCETEEICEAAGLKVSDLFDKELSQDNQKSGWDITNTYKYLDEEENLLFEKIRYKTKKNPKNFTQRRYVEDAIVFGLDEGTYYETYKGSNSWSMKQRDNANKRDFPGCRRVIYNLPYIIAAIKTGREVYIVEGEKDADNLKKWGLVATCNPDGASKSNSKPKWNKEFNQYFKNARVIILHDNDDAGRAHAENIAANLFDIAEYIKCPELDGLDEKGDISDWQEQGHTKEDLMSLIENTEVWDPSLQPDDVDLIRFNFSDVGNAERLLAMYGKIIRYSAVRRNWFIWTGKYWELDTSGRIESLARSVIKKLQQQGRDLPKDDQHENMKSIISKFVLKSESDNKIKAMINQAKTFKGSIMPKTDEDIYLLNLKNGTLNLRNGYLQKHNKHNYITKCIDIRYDKDSSCPNWIEFMNKIFLNNTELINYIQKSIGYSLTGNSNLQCFYIMQGKGSNGKGTFMQTLEKLLGPYYSVLAPESLMKQTTNGERPREDLAKLESTRFVCINECDENEFFDEGLIKRMSSGANEKFNVRRNFEGYFDLHPEFKMWMTTNGLPRIKGTDNGIWRRVRKIPFEYDFEKDPDKNVNFFDENLVPEIQGILNWAVEGCLKWQKEGENVPEAVLVENEKYKTDMDPIARFIDDRCIVSETCRTRIPELYDVYEEWCHENKEYVLSSIKLSKKLADKNFKQTKIMSIRYWSGLGIVDKDHQVDMEEVHNKVWPFDDK